MNTAILTALITSILSSSLIATIFQVIMQIKFKRLDAKYQSLSIGNKLQFEIQLKGVEDIWSCIIEAEHFLQHGIQKQINDAVANNVTSCNIDMEPLLQSYLLYQKKSIYLSDDTIKATDELFGLFETIYNGYIETCNLVIQNKAGLDNLNNYIPTMLHKMNYDRKKSNIKNLYIEEARNILCTDII